jgi:hypothetical protein
VKFHLVDIECTKVNGDTELRNCFDVLDISFADVMRLLAACLLLSRLHFLDEGGQVGVDRPHGISFRSFNGSCCRFGISGGLARRATIAADERSFHKVYFFDNNKTK